MQNPVGEGGPLDGLRVLDMSRIVSGPFAGRLLADMGALVIKLEPPEGDISRTVTPSIDGIPVYFTQMNAGKRNVCLDLKADGALDVLRKMVARSDVLIENFRPGVLDRLGLGIAELRTTHPRLIVCSISGWGQTGPWTQRRGHAPMMHAEAGWIDMAARVRGIQPLAEISQHADVYAAMLASNAILGAVIQRNRTGEGCHIDLNMGRSTTYVFDWASVEYLRWNGSRAPFDTWNHHAFRIGDGTAVILAGDPRDRFDVWGQMLASSGYDWPIFSDPRFATRDDRDQNFEALLTSLQEMMARIPDRAALDAVIEQHNYLGLRCQSLADLAETEWAHEIGLFAPPEVAGVAVPAAPFTFDNAYIGVRGPAPVPGADNAAVLAELADIGPDELAALIARGVVVYGGQYELIAENLAVSSPPSPIDADPPATAHQNNPRRDSLP